MASTSKCSVGVCLNEDCFKTTYNSQIGIKNINTFSEEYQLLLKLRSGFDEQLKDVCNHHEKYLLVEYLTFQYKCCDPLQVHKKPCKGSTVFLFSVTDVVALVYF